jgi:hypothetical protein
LDLKLEHQIKVNERRRFRPVVPSRLYVNMRGMRLLLVVETGDSVVDRAYESIGIGDSAIGE